MLIGISLLVWRIALDTIKIAFPPVNSDAPLDCLRNNPMVLEAIRTGISHAGYQGIVIADSRYSPSNGPGIVTYVYLNHEVGEALFHFGARRVENGGINHIVLPGTEQDSEIRLSFCQGVVAGQFALLNEKGPSSLKLLAQNNQQLSLSFSDDMAAEDGIPAELPLNYLNVWVVWKRYQDRMEAWLIVPTQSDKDGRRIAFEDFEYLGNFDHTPLPDKSIEKDTRPQSIPNPFTIEEKPDVATGTSG